jgi:hypothetical protein
MCSRGILKSNKPFKEKKLTFQAMFTVCHNVTELEKEITPFYMGELKKRFSRS